MNELPVTAPQRGTGLAFVQHWDWVAEKGLMLPATARAIRVAVSQILRIDDNWENIDVKQLDVDGLIARFRNLSDLAPGSLATYESRFRSGLESYLLYLDNPSSYQPKTRKPSPREDKPGSQPKSKGGSGAGGGSQNSPPGFSLANTSTKLVVYPFPVRPDVFAELKLPADLTADEAMRLSAFLKAVALSDDSGGKE
jgi:hypothetical protein